VRDGDLPEKDCDRCGETDIDFDIDPDDERDILRIRDGDVVSVTERPPCEIERDGDVVFVGDNERSVDDNSSVGEWVRTVDCDMDTSEDGERVSDSVTDGVNVCEGVGGGVIVSVIDMEEDFESLRERLCVGSYVSVSVTLG
jgi:hypothetical protein